MSKREQLDHHYYSSASDPSTWWTQAKRLILSARVLHDPALKYFTGTPEEKVEGEAHLNAFFILASFAIENGMKALVVHNRAEEIRKQLSERKKLPEILRTHDLLDLARLSNIPVLTKENELFLQRMTRYAVWAGRYPVPLYSEHIEVPTSLLASNEWVITNAYEEYDLKVCNILYGFLEKQWKERKAQQGVAGYGAQGAEPER